MRKQRTLGSILILEAAFRFFDVLFTAYSLSGLAIIIIMSALGGFSKWPKKVVEITAAFRYIGATLHSGVLCSLAIESRAISY